MRVAATVGLFALSVLLAGGGMAVLGARSPHAAGEFVTAPLPPSTGASSATAPAVASPDRRPNDLPTREIAQRPVHSIREDELPLHGAPITLRGRDGRVMSHLAGTLPRGDGRPPAAAMPAAVPGSVLAGAAQAAAGARLSVAGRAVPLFGVRPPESRDRCAAGAGAPHSCDDVARHAMARRLAGNPAVSCRLPPGQPAENAGAICLDSTGLDLGGWLVGEGLALAEPRQSYDYVGAEGVARSLRRGLWRYR